MDLFLKFVRLYTHKNKWLSVKKREKDASNTFNICDYVLHILVFAPF